MLAGANVERLVATPLYRRLAGERKIPQLDEFARKTRLDPEKDIQELLAASNGKDAIMMARVRIRDEKAVEAALEKEGAARTPSASTRCLEMARALSSSSMARSRLPGARSI